MPANNVPPVAHAGEDQVVLLPGGEAMLDGSNSSNPNGGMLKFYIWKQVGGPRKVDIQSEFKASSNAFFYYPGKYSFELTVEEQWGLQAKDTVDITVQWKSGCNPNIEYKTALATDVSGAPGLIPSPGNVARMGDWLIFSGGGDKSIYGGLDEPKYYDDLRLYNLKSTTWEIHKLTEARMGAALAAANGKIFLAGGYSVKGWSDLVEIYDIATGAITVEKLSTERIRMTATAIGDKIIFAGGFTNSTISQLTDLVEIYDMSTKKWSSTHLSQPRGGIMSTVMGDKVYFSGGYASPTDTLGSNIIDILDLPSGQWTSSTIQSPGILFSSQAMGTDLYLWGTKGLNILNLQTGARSNECVLTRPGYKNPAQSSGSQIMYKGSNSGIPSLGDKSLLLMIGSFALTDYYRSTVTGSLFELFDLPNRRWTVYSLGDYLDQIFEYNGEWFALKIYFPDNPSQHAPWGYSYCGIVKLDL